MPSFCELCCEFLDRFKEHGLAARDHNVAVAESFDFIHYLLQFDGRAFRLPACVRGVAPDAAKVAAAHSDERRRHTRPDALALYAGEDFGDSEL